jgi:hypothetical protein
MADERLAKPRAAAETAAENFMMMLIVVVVWECVELVCW